MRQLLTLLIAGMAFSAAAQPLFEFPGTERTWSKHVQQALDKKAPSAQKTTAAHERIIGFATYNTFSGKELTDSSNYKYSLDRGIIFNPNNMFIDEASILFDSATQFSDNGNGLELQYASRSTYDGSNRRFTLTSLTPVGSGMENNTEERHSYHSSGTVAVTYDLVWDAANSVWDTATRTDYKYDSQNNLVADSTYSYMSSSWTSKTEYTIDGNGNISQIDNYEWSAGWVPSGRELHTFNTDDNIIRSISQVYNGTLFVNSRLDSFAYNAGATIYNLYESRTWDNVDAEWVYESREIRVINSSNRVAVQTYKNFDTLTLSWQDNITIDWTYTSFNNPAMGIITFDEFGVEVAEVYLYYETYYDLAVKNVKQNTGKLIAYPNPATEKLTLSLQTPVSNATIQVTSMVGQTVFRTRQPFSGTSAEIPVNHLQPGTYRLTVHDANGEVLYNEAIAKQ